MARLCHFCCDTDCLCETDYVDFVGDASDLPDSGEDIDSED
jgi:hypothetical protein